MGSMSILCKTGDTEIRWDSVTGEGLETAKRAFEEKTRRQGYLAFIEGPGGEGAALIRAFDPQARSIVLAPRLVGG